MRPRLLTAALGIALVLLACLLASRRTPPSITGADSSPPASPEPRVRGGATSSSVAAVHPGEPSAASLPPGLESEIEAAVVTYSPKALPTFERLLSSGEPDVREAARDGLVRLGEKGGADLLRRATGRLTDPDEIRRFQETAELLELPSALEGPLKKGGAAN